MALAGSGFPVAIWCCADFSGGAAMSALLELADRCEAATGPDRRIDGLIFARLNSTKQIIIGTEPGRFPQKAIYGTPLAMLEMLEGDDQMAKDAADYLCAPTYTASLDAAMTLMPSTHYWSVGTIAQDGYEHYDDMDFAWAQTVHREGGNSINVEHAATVALALCAAALRARAQTEAGQ